MSTMDSNSLHHPVKAAKEAGLRYVSDAEPGIRRIAKGKGFSYVDAKGKTVTDRKTLERIKLLVIPPAYQDVWICPYPNGHLQAVGLDDRGRKQYRYHPRWREVRDENKYAHMVEFGKALPVIRERVQKDLGKSGIPREKVLAAIVDLMDKTSIRVGNEEYAKTNKTFGLTTMRTRHIEVSGTTINFQFKGKSGKVHEISLQDRRLANLVRKLQDLPGQELFQYVDAEEKVQSISSADVNAYLKEIAGHDFTAKDFRTWNGTVLAATTLQGLEPFVTSREAKRNLTATIKEVAQHLGNTPAICRKCYIHPSVMESYLKGELAGAFKRYRKVVDPKGVLDAEEVTVVRFLESLQA